MAASPLGMGTGLCSAADANSPPPPWHEDRGCVACNTPREMAALDPGVIKRV